MLKIGEFSKLCGIKQYTLRRLGKSGKFSPNITTNSGHRFYEKSQLEDAKKYIRKQKIIPESNSFINDEFKLDNFTAYLLGLSLSDGSVYTNNKIAIELKDEQLLCDIAKIIDVNVSKRKTRDMYRIVLPNKISKELSDLGVVRNKGTNGYKIPNMAKSNFGSFFRGMFDGDGCVDVKNNRLRVRLTGHYKPLGDIQKVLLEEYNIYAGWHKFINSTFCGNLEINKKESVSIMQDVMYNDINVCLERKKLVFDSFI